MNVAGDRLDVDGNASSSKASSCGVAAGEDTAGAAGLANCVCCSDPGSWPDVEGVTAAADCSRTTRSREGTSRRRLPARRVAVGAPCSSS